MNPIDALKMHGVGVGKKLVGDAQSGDVRAGKTFSNAQGNDKEGTMPVRSLVAQTVTPTTLNIIKQAGIYDGEITIEGDPDLVGANIISGRNIFGVAGTFNGKRMASGTAVTSENNGTTSSVVVSGLSFQPSVIVISVTAPADYGASVYWASAKFGNSTSTNNAFALNIYGDSATPYPVGVAPFADTYVNTTGFKLKTRYADNGFTVNWIAYE